MSVPRADRFCVGPRRRPARTEVLLATVALGLSLSFLGNARPAGACTCMAPDAFTALGSADVAAIGAIVEVNRGSTPTGEFQAVPDGRITTFTIDIDEAVKGTIEGRVEVQGGDPMGCGGSLHGDVGDRVAFIAERLGDRRYRAPLACGPGFTPESLRATPLDLPIPPGQGPIRFLGAREIGAASFAAFDALGHVLAWGFADQTQSVLAACPGGRRALAVGQTFETDPEQVAVGRTSIVADRIDLTTMEVVDRRVIATHPSSEAEQTHSATCLDPEGDRLGVIVGNTVFATASLTMLDGDAVVDVPVSSVRAIDRLDDEHLVAIVAFGRVAIVDVTGASVGEAALPLDDSAEARAFDVARDGASVFVIAQPRTIDGAEAPTRLIEIDVERRDGGPALGAARSIELGSRNEVVGLRVDRDSLVLRTRWLARDSLIRLSTDGTHRSRVDPRGETDIDLLGADRVEEDGGGGVRLTPSEPEVVPGTMDLRLLNLEPVPDGVTPTDVAHLRTRAEVPAEVADPSLDTPAATPSPDSAARDAAAGGPRDGGTDVVAIVVALFAAAGILVTFGWIALWFAGDATSGWWQRFTRGNDGDGK